MPLSQQQIEDRRKGIGGSDVAAILGICPWRSAMDVYAQKLNLVEPEPENQFTRWGHKHEPAIAAEFAEQHPELLVTRPPGEPVYYGPEPWMFAHPDRILSIGMGSPIAYELNSGLEIKNVGLRMAGRWEDGPPEYVVVQCRWYMMVLDVPHWWVAVLIGGNDYRECLIMRDLDEERRIVAACRAVWFGNVERQEPPEPSADDAKALAAIYPEDTAPILPATIEVDDLVLELKKALPLSDYAVAHVSVIRNKLRALIGDAAGVEGAWGRITWKQSKPSEKVDWKGVADAFGGELVVRGADVALCRETVEAYTETKPGARVFRPKWAKE